MKIKKGERGFMYLEHPEYLTWEDGILAMESSAIGDYKDSLERAGSSFLWIGEKHHLNREEVAELITFLQHWRAGILRREHATDNKD